MKAVRRERGREARAWLEEGSWGWLRGVARAARGNIAFILLITIGLLASLLSDVFLTPQNLVNILSASAVIGIIALGQTMLIISGNFDMSVASVLGFAGIVAVATQRLGLLPSILLALLGGVIVGAVNGLIVTRAKANPFLVTWVRSRSSTPLPSWRRSPRRSTARSQLSTFWARAGSGAYPLPSSSFWCWRSCFRSCCVTRSTAATSMRSARTRRPRGLAGIPVDRVLVSTFILCSLLAALGGIVMTSRLNSTVANAGFGFDFESIIAVVLGGTSLFGGSGGALLTVAGVLVLGVLNNTTILLGVPYEGQFIVKGVVFLAVVGLDSFVKRR